MRLTNKSFFIVISSKSEQQGLNYPRIIDYID